MIDFGKRVREFRQARRLTKEEFCQDESELSIRQLTRIESGNSIPTLAKVIYIAQRLGVTVGDLADEEHFKLPDRYQELKFLLLKTQTYLDKNRIAKRTAYLDEIFADYYDDLPEEEQLIIEVLQSRLELIKDSADFSVRKILEDYFEQLKQKTRYTINDFILVDLYSMYTSYMEFQETVYDDVTYQHIIDVLLDASDSLHVSEFFILINVISSAASNCMIREDLPNLQRLLTKMDELMHEAQEFQKMPTYNLLQWKYYLLSDNEVLAEQHYQNACFFAKMIQDPYLEAKLTAEWEQDKKN